ncbi:striatin-3 isoform X2 [Nilaparvata lugens]|uniref:striatin-3 isoform X2 n=1 Tax=Nilaparvata lugens TaxID=108931 RepID=UPI00193E4581|nr:striatin-3 isoform X2 [Nilaparvata lugens]
MKIPVQCGGPTMEDSSPSQNHNGQIGSSSGGINVGNKQNDDGNQQIQYSIPGILHFIQHEWARFEMERSQWDVDKAELQARIAFLQGERKGQENLKNDLVRRIKMLEYALKEERAKYHKLKFGTELSQGDMSKPPMPQLDESGLGGGERGGLECGMDSEAPFTSVSNISWRQGRQLLRQYLQEIGYTDTIIDVRSNRVRSLLGLNNNEESVGGGGQGGGGMGGQGGGGQQGGGRGGGGQGAGVNGNMQRGRDQNDRSSQHQSYNKSSSQPSSLTEQMMLDTEAAVMANFEFLAQAEVDLDDDDDDDDDMDQVEGGGGGGGAQDDQEESLLVNETDDVDAEAEEVLNELNLLTETVDGNEIRSQVDPDWDSSASGRRALGEEGSLGLGELAQLTVNNEAEAAYTTYDMKKESYRKTWNAKYTLRSHFDGVRALAFHPREPVLITASEDHTLKLWNLQKTVPAKKSASLDVEPLYTFRCHKGSVLCVAMADSGKECYSGGLDGAIHCWQLPTQHIDPYDSFDPNVRTATLLGHTDAVCGLSVAATASSQHLLSCAADGTVKLWAPDAKASALATYVSEQDGIPTSVDFVKNEPDRVLAAYNSAHCVIFDLETSKPLLRLESAQEVVNSVLGRQINRAVCHPTLPLTMTAHDDRHIRFFDNCTGKMVHSMVAHLDAVTSIAVDPNGLYLLSGSHDCSIRLWNLDNKTCVQEITAHRKKFDESILDVAFHPSRPYIASAGADGLAKVFV